MNHGFSLVKMHVVGFSLVRYYACIYISDSLSCFDDCSNVETDIMLKSESGYESSTRYCPMQQLPEPLPLPPNPNHEGLPDDLYFQINGEPRHNARWRKLTAARPKVQARSRKDANGYRGPYADDVRADNDEELSAYKKQFPKVQFNAICGAFEKLWGPTKND